MNSIKASNPPRVRRVRYLSPSACWKGELKQKTRIFYEIYDEAWVEWLQKAFWNIFRTSIDAKERVKDIEQIEKL